MAEGILAGLMQVRPGADAEMRDAGAISSQGGGGGKGQQPIVNLLARLAVAHDRSIQELFDCHCLALIVNGQDAQSQLLAARDQWRTQRPEVQGQPHPCGSSQRVIMYAVLLLQIKAAIEKLPAGEQKTAAMSAVGKLNVLQGPDIEANVFRLKPRHDTPHAEGNRAWVWFLMFSSFANQEFKDGWRTLCAYDLKLDSINVAPARSQDGPITKQIVEWLGGGKGGGGGKGKGGGKAKGDGKGVDGQPRSKRGRV